MNVRIDHFEVDGPYEMVATWHNNSDVFESAANWRGDASGKLLITLGVDGMFNAVTADLVQTGTVAALDEAITTLQRLRRLLDAIPNLHRGRCLHHGDEGRCWLDHAHPGPCRDTITAPNGAPE